MILWQHQLCWVPLRYHERRHRHPLVGDLAVLRTCRDALRVLGHLDLQLPSHLGLQLHSLADLPMRAGVVHMNG